MNQKTQNLKQLELVYQAVAKMHFQELDQVLQTILECVTKQIGFDRARLYLCDKSNKNLTCRMISGMTIDSSQNITLPIKTEKSIVAKCFIEKNPISIKDALTEPGVNKELVQLFNIKSFVAVPLLGRFQTKGVITADYSNTQKNIETNTVEILVIFSNLAALAIENAEIHNELVDLNRYLKDNIQNAKKELKLTQKQLIEKERIGALGEMAAGLAHEIRNPLTSINLLLETLLNTQDFKQSQKQDLNIIHKETRRLNKLMDEILQFAKSSHKSFKLIPLKPVLDITQKMIEKICLKANVNLSIIWNKKNDFKVMADEGQLQQVLYNLCWNGIEAMPDGGQLTISIKEKQAKIEIKIIDTGIGIKKNQFPMIFRPFYTTKTTGTGLGLSTVQKIIHEHLGSISLKSSPDHGTQFIILLPSKMD